MMIDVHCHLDKMEDVDAEIAMIINGTDWETSKKAVETAEKYENVWACVGMYPDKIYNLQFTIYNELLNLAKHPKVVGIGEVGLDFNEQTAEEEKRQQIKVFTDMLDLAREVNFPVVVHNRGADREIKQVLSTQYSVLRGKVLLHCFTGTIEFMQEMAELGCYFSFGGMITYKKNDWLREVVRAVPEGRLLVETDSPYLPPEPLRGTINTPKNVKIVAEAVASIRGTSLKVVEKMTTSNALKLFNRITYLK